MKKLWAVFITVVATPFIVVGIIIFKGCDFEFPLKEVYLNTSKMKEADTGVIYHNHNSSIIKAYTFDIKQNTADAISPADVFIYAFFKDSLNKTADTVILIDTHLHGSLEPKRISDYYYEFNESQKLDRCKLLIPKYQIPLIKGYKYRYVNVQIIAED